MKVLDLFCGAGGAAMGLHQAWPEAEITGVDLKPQPRYPFNFIQANAMEFPLQGFDFIWASPPCQAYTCARHIQKREHPKLIPAVRTRLQASGIPYVIENVPGAPLENAVQLCGTFFGLAVVAFGTRYELRRHRFFEASFRIAPAPCCHQLPVIGVYGHGESKPMRDKRGFQISQVAHRREVMQMPWANRDEIAEAIPPAYSRHVAGCFDGAP
jgi:DNA (cytosine-5)-methyltransferase 1